VGEFRPTATKPKELFAKKRNGGEGGEKKNGALACLKLTKKTERKKLQIGTSHLRIKKLKGVLKPKGE